MKSIGILLTIWPTVGGGYQYAQSVVDAVATFQDYERYIYYTDGSWEGFFSDKDFRYLSLPGNISIGEMVNIINNDNLDLLIMLNYNDMVFIDLLNMPIVMPIHDLMHVYERGHGFTEIEDNNTFIEREKMFGKICRSVVGVLVDSELGRQQVLKQYGQELSDKVYVLPYTVPKYILGNNKVDIKSTIRDKYFFYPAQFWRHKNHKNLILAIHRLKQSGLLVNMVFVGSPKNEYENILKLIDELQLQEQITILGYVADEEMYSLYKNARALIMPTYFGPTNIPPLEGMAIGCPVAVSNIYAMPEQIGDAGLLFDPNDVDELAETMRILWTNDELCQIMKIKGQRQASKFTPDVFACKLHKHIEAILHNREGHDVKGKKQINEKISLNVFKDYAYYYDLFYRNKDYFGEAEAIAIALKKYGISQNNIISFGCGTGRYEYELRKHGFHIHGIDISEDMIKQATEKFSEEIGLTYEVADIRSYSPNKSYSAVISLFQVMSYQTSTADLINAFKSARKCLETGGVFLFDVWYGSGVLTSFPEVRVKRFIDDNGDEIVRIATPVMHEKDNTVDVHYDIMVISKNGVKQFAETHRMRYYFKPEIEYYLQQTGFELIDNFSHDFKESSFSSWTSYFVAIAR